MNDIILAVDIPYGDIYCSYIFLNDDKSHDGTYIRWLLKLMRNLCYLICLRHLIAARAVTNRV